MISGGHLQATVAFLTDQAVCSAGNFLTSFLVARNVSSDKFGVFALLNIILIFSLTVNNWLIRASLSETAQIEDSGGVREYTSALVGLAGLFGIAPAIVLVCAAIALHHPELCFALGVCAVASQVQETMRRSAMAQSKYRTAVLGDSISYLGQAGVMFWAVQDHALSLRLVFWTMAVTSVASTVLQTRGLRLGPPTRLQTVLLQCWKHGRWITLSGLILSPLVYGLPWIVEFTRGQSEAGMLSGLILVLGLSNPIMFSSTWLILVRGQAAKYASLPVLFKRIGPTVLLTGLPLVIYWAVIFLFPGRVLHLFYGDRGIYLNLTGSLRLVTIYYLASYAAVCLEVLVDTREQSRSRFWIDATASLLMLSVGLPVATKSGVPGLLCVGILAHLLRAVAYSLLLGKSASSRPASVSPVALRAEEVQQ